MKLFFKIKKALLLPVRISSLPVVLKVGLLCTAVMAQGGSLKQKEKVEIEKTKEVGVAAQEAREAASEYKSAKDRYDAARERL